MMGQAYRDAQSKITALSNLGQRITAVDIPPTPDIANRKPSSRPGSRGSQIQLQPLNHDVAHEKPYWNNTGGFGRGSDKKASTIPEDKEPDVSPISGYPKWAKFYDLDTPGGGGNGYLPKTLKQELVEFLESRFGSVLMGWKALTAKFDQDESLTLEEFGQAYRFVRSFLTHPTTVQLI